MGREKINSFTHTIHIMRNRTNIGTVAKSQLSTSFFLRLSLGKIPHDFENLQVLI